jgi:vanillate monooxygenase ferredoxin subunit
MSTDLITLRVARKQMLAQDICGLELESSNGAALPGWQAGAHIDLHIGPPESRFVRPYSLCGVPAAAATSWQIAVLREAASRGGSAAVHAWLGEGRQVQVSQPRNHFPLLRHQPHSLLLAGGIGITPLLAMAEQLHLDGSPFTLHHCTRSLARTPFVQRLNAAPFAAQVQRHLDDGAADQRLHLQQVLAQPAPGRHLYVCGPAGFMDAALGMAQRQGWHPDQVHSESFGAPVQPAQDDQAFDLVLLRSARVIRVEADQTAAQALHVAGVYLATSCEQGVCGTCLTVVTEGTPDHRDQYLSPEEQAANDQFLPCCSRARGARLVVDL